MARVFNDRIVLIFWRLGTIQTHAEQHLGFIIFDHYQATDKGAPPKKNLEQLQRCARATFIIFGVCR